MKEYLLDCETEKENKNIQINYFGYQDPSLTPDPALSPDPPELAIDRRCSRSYYLLSCLIVGLMACIPLCGDVKGVGDFNPELSKCTKIILGTISGMLILNIMICGVYIVWKIREQNEEN